MANHDKYDTDILKALQRIATSLDKIEKHLNSNNIVEKCYNCKFQHFSGYEEPCKSCLPKTYGETSIGHMTNFQNKEE